jgi:hypothetical protein
VEPMLNCVALRGLPFSEDLLAVIDNLLMPQLYDDDDWDLFAQMVWCRVCP